MLLLKSEKMIKFRQKVENLEGRENPRLQEREMGKSNMTISETNNIKDKNLKQKK